MSNKKFCVLFFGISLAVYCALFAAVCVPLYYERSATEKNILASRMETAEQLFAEADVSELNETMYEYVKRFGSSFQSDVPYRLAVFSLDGTLLAESDDFLYARAYANTAFETDVYVDLRSLMTDALRSQISAYCRKAAGGEYVLVESLELQATGETYVPVKMTLAYSSFSKYRKTCEVVFLPDAEGDLNIGQLDAELYLFDVHPDRVLNRRLQQMQAAVPEVGEQLRANMETAADYQADPAALLWRYLTDLPQISLNCFPVTQNGETLVVALFSTSRPILQTLSLAGQRLFVMTLFFVFFTVVLLVFALRYRRGRARLAHARYSFLSAAAHELKTPLAVITNAGECIAQAVDPAKNTAYADMILHESARMKTLVEQMLQQNRFLSADAARKKPTDLSALTEETVNAYKIAAEQKSIALSMDVAPALFVNGDARMLAVALQNFLSNAVKYAPAGEKIRVALKKEGKKIRLTVANTGSRISAQALPHIWEELYREDAVRGDGAGSGLGLSICRSVFKLHRFAYGCVSDDGETAFWFSAPIAKPEKPQNKKSPQRARWGCTPAELCAGAAVFLIGAALILLFIGLRLMFNVLLIVCIVSASVGMLCGALGFLLTTLERRDGRKHRWRWLLLLSWIFTLLPPLVYALLYLAGANGW